MIPIIPAVFPGGLCLTFAKMLRLVKLENRSRLKTKTAKRCQVPWPGICLVLWNTWVTTKTKNAGFVRVLAVTFRRSVLSISLVSGLPRLFQSRGIGAACIAKA